MKIFIDRGHSYLSPGAAGYADETFLTHAWGDAIYNKIVAFGGDVTLLEDGNSKSQDLEIPVKQANSYGRDSIFFSVHANAGVESANGSEIFTYSGSSDAKTQELAEAIYSAFRSVVPDLNDRGIKKADFYVLRETVMPAALIELAFVTNEKDAVCISNPAIIEKASEAMAIALMQVAGQEIYGPGINDPATALYEFKDIEEGTYLIVSKKSGKALDVNTYTGKVIQYRTHGKENQRWIVLKNQDGSYLLSCLANGKQLDIAGNSQEDGAEVLVWDTHNGANQKFKFATTGEIVAMHSGKPLDVYGGYEDDVTPIIQYTGTGALNQQWYFIKVC